MARVWCVVLLVMNTWVAALAQAGPLPLRLGGTADGQVSARRERLVTLLTELIERHGPLGLWTRLDEDDAAESRSGDRRALSRNRNDYDRGTDEPIGRSASGTGERAPSAARVIFEDDEDYIGGRSGDSGILTAASFVEAGRSKSSGKNELQRNFNEPRSSSFGAEDGLRRSGSDRSVEIGTVRFGDGGNGGRKTDEGNTRRGGAPGRGKAVRVSTRRRGGTVVRIDAPLPGERFLGSDDDCDEDERIRDDDDRQDEPIRTSNEQHRRPPFRPEVPPDSRDEEVPISKPKKDRNKQTARPPVRNPNQRLEPPYTASTYIPPSTPPTLTPTTASSISGNKIVAVLLKTWQDETHEARSTPVIQRLQSDNEHDFDNYADVDESPAERIPESPRWHGSMMIRGVLTAPVARYNENYIMWYDADTSDSRVDFSGGASSALRFRMSDGSYQLLSKEETRSGKGGPQRVCRMGSGVILSGKETMPPGLPDMKQFKFAGWLDGVDKAEAGGAPSDSRAERWQRVVRVKEGSNPDQSEGEEYLTYRHEMIVVRRFNNPVPLRYTVMVDSSILGAASDFYMHMYQEVEHTRPEPEKFSFDIETECDRLEEINATDPEGRAVLEPLREFTQESHGSLYRVKLERYKIRFVRQYINYDEEVLRKNILMQTTRFVAAVNRRAERFRLEVNFLADRVQAEINQLFGARPEPHGGPIAPAVPFPYTRSSLRRRVRKLPRAFDWREKGAVTPVKFQGVQCMSCWAFAVVGAVESGLFVRTRRKVALSEQCLVDCGHKTDAKGCSGTWPKYAYEYVRKYGLPTNSSYSPYIAAERSCKAEGLSPLVFISGHVDVIDHSVDALKISIYENGPVVVQIDSKSEYFRSYKEGILDDPICGNRASDTNHAVLAVGWGESDGSTYFIMKNSWSATHWGDGGYVKMDGRRNQCGLLTRPSYPHIPRLENEISKDSSAEEDVFN